MRPPARALAAALAAAALGVSQLAAAQQQKQTESGESGGLFGGIMSMFGLSGENHAHGGEGISQFYTVEHKLESTEFKQLLAEKHMVGILFFSPTCGYSRMVQPMWDKVVWSVVKQ